MHENAYVASVSLSADVNQTVKAFKEAEAYEGPSIIIAYATCVDWGHRAGDKAMVHQQAASLDQARAVTQDSHSWLQTWLASKTCGHYE